MKALSSVRRWRMNRREFVKTTAAVSLAAALPRFPGGSGLTGARNMQKATIS